MICFPLKGRLFEMIFGHSPLFLQFQLLLEVQVFQYLEIQLHENFGPITEEIAQAKHILATP